MFFLIRWIVVIKLIFKILKIFNDKYDIFLKIYMNDWEDIFFKYVFIDLFYF